MHLPTCLVTCQTTHPPTQPQCHQPAHPPHTNRPNNPPPPVCPPTNTPICSSCTNQSTYAFTSVHPTGISCTQPPTPAPTLTPLRPGTHSHAATQHSVCPHPDPRALTPAAGPYRPGSHCSATSSIPHPVNKIIALFHLVIHENRFILTCAAEGVAIQQCDLLRILFLQATSVVSLVEYAWLFSHWCRRRQNFDIDSRILTSTSQFNLTPNWWVSKSGPDYSLTSSKILTPSPL